MPPRNQQNNPRKQANQPRYQKSSAPASGGGSLKKRARGLQRLLQRDSLPAAVRTQKEAELAALQGEAVSHSAKHKRTERERHFSKKYHKVKFFERRKVERRLQLLRKEDADADAIREAEHNLLYIKHFPRHKKYLALFPKENAEDQFVAKRRARIRASIVRRAEEGTLGRPTDEGDDDDDEAEAAAAAEGAATLDDDFFAADDDGGDDAAAPGWTIDSVASGLAAAAEDEPRKKQKRWEADGDAAAAGEAERKKKKTKKKRGERLE